jgi:hypothetical protein
MKTLQEIKDAGGKAKHVAAAAQVEGFSRSTLARKYKAFKDGQDIWADSKRGRPAALSQLDEKRLAEWVQECAVRGVPQLVSSVKLRAKQLLVKAGGRFNTKSKTGLPSDSWFKGSKLGSPSSSKRQHCSTAPARKRRTRPF